MNPIDALVYLVVAIVVCSVGVLVWAYIIFRRAEEADRMGVALWPDPAKTAGGSAGKSYTGGFDAYAYFIPGEPDYDHHSIAEYDAIAADRELEAPHDAATRL